MADNDFWVFDVGTRFLKYLDAYEPNITIILLLDGLVWRKSICYQA